jgi:hypothetical protein
MTDIETRISRRPIISLNVTSKSKKKNRRKINGSEYREYVLCKRNPMARIRDKGTGSADI